MLKRMPKVIVKSLTLMLRIIIWLKGCSKALFRLLLRKTKWILNIFHAFLFFCVYDENIIFSVFCLFWVYRVLDKTKFARPPLRKISSLHIFLWLPLHTFMNNLPLIQDCRATPSAVHVCDKVPQAICEDKPETETKYVYEEECNKVDRIICRPVTKRECNPVVEVVPVVEMIQKIVSETVCAPPPFSLYDPLTQGNNENDSNDNGSSVDSKEDNAIDYSDGNSEKVGENDSSRESSEEDTNKSDIEDSEEDNERDSSFDDSVNQSSVISNLFSFFNSKVL